MPLPSNPLKENKIIEPIKLNYYMKASKYNKESDQEHIEYYIFLCKDSTLI